MWTLVFSSSCQVYMSGSTIHSWCTPVSADTGVKWSPSHRLLPTLTFPLLAHNTSGLPFFVHVYQVDTRACMCVHPQMWDCCWHWALRKCQSTSVNERYHQYLVASTHTLTHTYIHINKNKPRAMARHTTCQLCTTMAPSTNSVQGKEDVAGSSNVASVEKFDHEGAKEVSLCSDSQVFHEQICVKYTLRVLNWTKEKS